MLGRISTIAFCFFMAIVWAAANLFNEDIPAAEVQAAIENRSEPLRQMTYRPNNRNANFVEMGLPQDLADETTAAARKLDKNKKRFRKLLKDQAIDMGPVFCPNPSGVPQPYAAMEYIVEQDGGQRQTVNALNALFAFERQGWYARDTNAKAIYNKLELTQRRKSNATLMGVAAILSKRENDAEKGRGPWSESLFLGGDFGDLESDQPAMRQKVVEYFALMHLLTELANDPTSGICVP